MLTWKIEKRNLSDLKGYDKNPRKFTKKGLADLKKSLERLGDANIITINSNNTVIGGHARLSVMKQLGYKTVDVKVPDRLLSEKEVKEVVIRLNANNAGEWDIDKLKLDFDIPDLKDWGLDFDLELPTSEEIIVTPIENKTNETSIEELVENLPEELQGIKIEPEPFQQIVSSFKTERERVIITFPEEKKQQLATILGIKNVDKVVYTIEEILGE